MNTINKHIPNSISSKFIKLEHIQKEIKFNQNKINNKN